MTASIRRRGEAHRSAAIQRRFREGGRSEPRDIHLRARS